MTEKIVLMAVIIIVAIGGYVAIRYESSKYEAQNAIFRIEAKLDELLKR